MLAVTAVLKEFCCCVLMAFKARMMLIIVAILPLCYHSAKCMCMVAVLMAHQLWQAAHGSAVQF